MKLIDLGKEDYLKVWEYQKELYNKAIAQKKEHIDIENSLIFCEHPPVYTLGKSGNESNLLFSKEILGAPVYRIERGGDITFHGEGQLVGYPIFDLDSIDIGIKDFVFAIEEMIINTVAHYEIIAERDEKNAGVWLDVGKKNQRKIAALGFKISKKISMHGFALNINTDLSWFNKVVPCGLVGLGVTSLEKELNTKQDYKKVQAVLLSEFKKVFPLA
jgi:lipoyl(octanoyl) transferase